MKKRRILKKGLAILLTSAMVAGLAPAMSGGAVEVQAATENGTGSTLSVTAFATKEQMMNETFAPDENGAADNYGKLVFGKNYEGSAQQWYILGQDDGVDGDNTIIFAASVIVPASAPYGVMFVSNSTDSSIPYNYEAGTGYGETPGIIDVYRNHYGASSLRGKLQDMASDINYFTEAEQGLMNATTVTTKDTKNDIDYTTTDKLYALEIEGDCPFFPTTDPSSYKTIKAGTNGDTVLAMSNYWKSGNAFWLRLPSNANKNAAQYAFPARGGFVAGNNTLAAVRPASNLNLSSVLFASSATAASSDTAVSGTITSGTAMTLRLDGTLDGTDKNIGTVKYNIATGDIKATKGNTEGDVALVVQGNDGTNDWYYSKKITGKEVVNVSDVKTETYTPESIDLSTCKIWLETTDSTENLIYAVEATEVVSITSVAITGVDSPEAATDLDTSASCETTGVSSTTPQITWTPSDSIAGYDTSYTASITLTAGTGYEFADNVTVTVLGNTATSVTNNEDETLTVTYDFSATPKRKIIGVTAPTVPTNNTFTTYYGYDGYDVSPISGSNTELGTAATVKFEGTMAPTTADMAVTWKIESAGGVYDKTLGAENIFRWTIPADALTNYNATACQGYDADTGTITGTVTITNKAAPLKGDVVMDDKGTGNYKVTDVAKKEVAYQAPADKNATTISIPATVTIGGGTYKVTSIADNAFANNKKITKVTIGSNVKTIGKKAFYKCTKLKTVTIGKNVTTIGASAFYGCSKLSSVTMGSNVTTISDKAFYKCTSLTKITIPSKVKKIGKQAFYGCKKLKNITIKTKKLTSKNVGSSAFKGIYSKATIKVPKSKLTSYKKILKAKGVSSKAKIKK